MELHTHNLKLNYTIQTMVYRIYTMFKGHTIEKKRELSKLVKYWLDDLVEIGFISYGEYKFDEEIWLPNKKDEYGNIFRLTLKIKNSLEMYIFEIDLTKDSIYECMRHSDGIPIADPFSQELHFDNKYFLKSIETRK